MITISGFRVARRMVDASFVRLLRECDNYLDRQRALLEHAAFIDCDAGLMTAMDAALDQLTGAVVDGWSVCRAEDGDPDTPSRRFEP